ncbi:unnamed protein product [Cuscuta epithymum]|uniref:Uncharacterized protein n=1 Tax=Cuscuta epithymum TaxID=186058 RepID=A0AAV0F0J7_9ASTE|nr:unnamed protein product [Cuscuta epithymum]
MNSNSGIWATRGDYPIGGFRRRFGETIWERQPGDRRSNRWRNWNNVQFPGEWRFPTERNFYTSQARRSSGLHRLIMEGFLGRHHLRASTDARGQVRWFGFQPPNQQLRTHQSHGVWRRWTEMEKSLQQTLDSTHSFEVIIESKAFRFTIIDCNVVRISEMKHGITSAINLDIVRLTWLKNSILKIFSRITFGSKIEMNKSVPMLYDANFFWRLYPHY